MEKGTALQRLKRAETKLRDARPDYTRREDYYRGAADLPYAPPGVTAEYEELREQSLVNYIAIAMDAPVQRLRADGIKTNLGKEADDQIWAAWAANKLDTRQSLVYSSMLQHGRGLMSVWPNKQNKLRPRIRPESVDLVHLEPDPDDPFTPLWAAKVYDVDDVDNTAPGLVLPSSYLRQKTVGVVYDGQTIHRFERGGIRGTGDWTLVLEATHPMKRVPFSPYDYKPKITGEPHSGMGPLIRQQDAINTIRFNTLLAMQYSAYRQRIITGFDPRVLDEKGNPVYQKNPDGTIKLDANGNPIPQLNSPGRVGVDRLLAFPGEKTSVFDLPESDLENYITVLDSFLTQFFSTGQVPPQYLLSQMANLSGDALAGAESTLASLVKELQLAAGEGNEGVAELAWYAMGETKEFEPTSETNWADAEARSFSQIVDAITKLISQGFPKQAAFEMIPGATQQKVGRWMELIEDEEYSNRLALAARSFTDATDRAPAELEAGNVTDQTEVVTSGAADSGD